MKKKKTSPLKTQFCFFPSPGEEAAMVPVFLQNYLPCILHTVSESDTEIHVV